MKYPNFNDWFISYDPYTDFFQMYDESILKSYKEDLVLKKNGHARLYFSKRSPKLLLIEVDGVYDKFKKDINSMTKKQVVGLIKPLINSFI